MSHKRNDFVNVKTTVGTIINRPKIYNQFDIDKSKISVYNKNTKELFDRRSAQCKVIKITVSLALGGYFFIAKM